MPYLYQTKNGMQYSIAPIGAGRYCANKIMGGQVTPHGAPVIHYPPRMKQ